VLRAWEERDPIERFRVELEQAGLWDDDRHADASAAVEARLDRIIDAALRREVDPPEALDHITATPDARTATQRAEIVARRSAPIAPETGTVSWRA